jgi:Domain of unknown function (DUF5753)
MPTIGGETVRKGREMPLIRELDPSAGPLDFFSPKVMYDQLRHLADCAGRTGITIQVVPVDAGAHAGLLGAFIVAGFGETAPSIGMWKRCSRDLIEKVAEERWT